MDASKKEPMPVINNGRFIVDLVIDDFKRRAEVGEKKYGIKLQADNGRDSLLDAYEEAIDLVMYLRQAIEEGR